MCQIYQVYVCSEVHYKISSWNYDKETDSQAYHLSSWAQRFDYVCHTTSRIFTWMLLEMMRLHHFGKNELFLSEALIVIVDDGIIEM